MIKKFDIILWDFDGVILDSMDVRDYGFREIFKSYDKHLVDKLITFHRVNGGLSRYVKIRYFFENLLNTQVDEATVNKLAEDFSLIMRQELPKEQYLIKDAVTYIKKNYLNQIFHIVSGSDEEELKWLCKQLNIHNFFYTINGSPTPKNKLVGNILSEFKYNKDKTCLVGDSINDFEAAEKNNIEFIGYNNLNLNNLIPASFAYIESFSNLKYNTL